MPVTIVVPLDGTTYADRALPVADLIARRSGGSIVLVAKKGDAMPLDLDGFLDVHANRLRINASHAVFNTGTADEAISAVAARHPNAIVVMASHGHTAIGEIVLGGVTARVLHDVKAPVLLLGPHVDVAGDAEKKPLAFATMLVCVDGSKTGEAAVALARRWATTLALNAWIVQVIDPPDFPLGAPPAHERVNEAGYVAGLAHELEKGGITTGYDVLHDAHPARAIVRFARGLPNPIIAMATHGRTGLSRIAMGSVAMDVVRHANCPVLVSRPSGLDSAEPTNSWEADHATV